MATENSDGNSKHGTNIRLERNQHTWAKAATMIYVDSPVGSGLSYADVGAAGGDDGAVHMDDEKTTDDLLEFIVTLLTQEFPNLRSNPLYIAGELHACFFLLHDALIGVRDWNHSSCALCA
jgi:carboxypeptidase C (cathepsin A)